jgi:ATP-binding cassette subfamily B protein
VKQTNGAASRPKDTQESNPDAWLRRLARYCWRHKRSMMLALAGALAATLATAAIPLILGLIVDDTILTHRAPVWAGALVLIGAGLLNFAGVYTRRFEGGKLSLDVQHDMRTESFAALAALDGARQDQLRTGQVVSRAISDLNMVQGLLGMLPMLLGSALLFVLSVTIMAFLSPLLTLVALAIGPALWLIALRSRLRLFPASWDAQQQAANVAGVVEGAVTGVRVVKGFGQEEQEIGRLEDASSALFASRVRAVRLMARYNPALQAVPLFGQVGVLALGGWLTIKGSIPLGTFLAFSLYVAQMISPVRALAALVTIGQEARASVIRIFEVIDARPVITERPGAVPLPPGTTDIELDRVEFGYQPDQPVLRGLSLRIRPGQTLALVGTSGSGKSTVSLLLPRFYDVTEGAIRIGGHDVRDLTTESLRAAIGLVPEDSFLFSDTVRANIAYGRPDATDAEVEAAARAAQAHDFIMALPDGYATVVGEQGLTLSGGQRQRVCLARALVTDPAVLVLDDATSAVDANVEARIHDALRSAMAGRTTLLIAHRQSTLALADQIAVLDAGRLVDLGTHEELTARCPLYQLLLAGTAEADASQVPAQAGGAEAITSALWGGGRRSQQHRLVAGRGAAWTDERVRSDEGATQGARREGSAYSGPQRAASTAYSGPQRAS